MPSETQSTFSDGIIMTEHVLLLHGIHMHAWTMLPFARLLSEHGFNTQVFGYYSIMQNLNDHSQALAKRVQQHYQTTDAPLHLVGHSLGGLVLRRFAHDFPDWVRGKIVTLGTPHQGSQTAHLLKRFMPFTLGFAYRNALDGNVPPLPENICLGSIAGCKSLGLGQVFHLDNGNDGTVTIAETRLAGMRDHIILPVSHTGMLLDKACATQTAHFLKHGSFNKNLLTNE